MNGEPKKEVRNALVEVPRKVWNREEILNAMKGMMKQVFFHTRIIKGSTLNNLNLEIDSDFSDLLDLDMTAKMERSISEITGANTKITISVVPSQKPVFEEPKKNALAEFFDIAPRPEPVAVAPKVEPLTSGVKEFIEIKTRAIGGESVNSVSARELYLDLGFEASNWAKWARINIAENMFFKQDVDFIELVPSTSCPNPAKEYAVSLNMAQHLAMMAKTQRAHDYRNHFIECEKKAKSVPKIDHLAPEVLLTMKAAREFGKGIGSSKPVVDAFVNKEIQRIFGIDPIQLVTGSRNEQLQLRIVK